MTFLLFVDPVTNDFILRREGQSVGGQSFPEMRTALRYLEAEMGEQSALVLVHNREGNVVLELKV